MNVLFVVFDDLNDSVVRMGGHPQARTPNIERVMRRGIRFTNAQTNAPICGPSRASFLTGLYPHTSGLYGYEMFQNSWMQNPVLARRPTFMEHFRAHGYAVHGTGKVFHHRHEKWEVWDDEKGESRFGTRPNFGPYPWDGRQETLTWGYNGLGHPSLPNTFTSDDLFARLSDVPSFPADVPRNVPGHTGWILDQKPYRYVGPNDRDPLPDEASARFAAGVIREARSQRQPFMLCVGFVRPHAPLIVPDEYFDLFPLDDIELARSLPDDLADCAETLWKGTPDLWTESFGRDRYRKIMEGGGEDLLRRFTQAYLAAVAYADAQLGVVLDALEETKQLADTLVVVTSDNGFHMGEKEQVYKNTVWEEACRVPLVVSGPGLASGEECTRPVSLVDLYPTLTDYCDLPHPLEEEQPLDGVSLRPLLADPASAEWTGPEIAVSALASNKPILRDTVARARDQHFSARSERYRYVLCRNDEEELYDHENDPFEWHNLAFDSTFSTVKEELREQLISITGCR